jgi:hypothetical protein
MNEQIACQELRVEMCLMVRSADIDAGIDDAICPPRGVHEILSLEVDIAALINQNMDQGR